MTGQAPARVKTRPVTKHTSEMLAIKIRKPLGLKERFGVSRAENS